MNLRYIVAIALTNFAVFFFIASFIAQALFIGHETVPAYSTIEEIEGFLVLLIAFCLPTIFTITYLTQDKSKFKKKEDAWKKSLYQKEKY